MVENGNMYMPVAPAYGNGGGFGFGNDWGWIILLLLFAGGGFGGFGGGYGNMMLGYDFPWLLNGQNGINNNVSDGFRTAQLSDSLTSIRDGITGVSTQLCNGFAGVNQAVSNGFAQAEIANNSRQIADMQQMFGIQSALQNCCCENRAGIADLKYTVATENCADRTQAMQNTRDIIDSQTRSTQAVLDKLCQLELDGVKAQVEAKNDRISELQTQLNMANLAASQTRQNVDIQNNLLKELRSCPIPAQPVYGSQPIFTCPNNNYGCGCGSL